MHIAFLRLRGKHTNVWMLIIVGRRQYNARVQERSSEAKREIIQRSATRSSQPKIDAEASSCKQTDKEKAMLEWWTRVAFCKPQVLAERATARDAQTWLSSHIRLESQAFPRTLPGIAPYHRSEPEYLLHAQSRIGTHRPRVATNVSACRT